MLWWVLTVISVIDHCSQFCRPSKSSQKWISSGTYLWWCLCKQGFAAKPIAARTPGRFFQEYSNLYTLTNISRFLISIKSTQKMTILLWIWSNFWTMRLKLKNPFLENLYYDVLKEFTSLLIQNRSIRNWKKSYLMWMRIGSQKLVVVDMVSQLDTCIPKISQIQLKSHFSCSYPSNTSIINKIGENLISFDSFFDVEPKHEIQNSFLLIFTFLVQIMGP